MIPLPILRTFLLLCLALLGTSFSASARAAMEIQVFGGAANKIAVAMVPFQTAPGQPMPALTQIAGDDLNRSGLFKLVDVSGTQQPVEPAQVDYPIWRGKGAEALVIGQVTALPGGRFEVAPQLRGLGPETRGIGHQGMVQVHCCGRTQILARYGLVPALAVAALAGRQRQRLPAGASQRRFGIVEGGGRQ